MAAHSDPPIIITGGSVTLEFDDSQLQQVSKGKHHHPHKTIRRVVIKGGGLDIDESVNNGNVTITVYYDEGKP
jgi:hypothetical protein